MCGTSQKAGIWRLSLEQIEATVAEHLGCGRVLGNQRGPCFSRQVSMYLQRTSEGEHDADRPVLQPSPSHHCSLRDWENRTPSTDR